MGAKGPIKCVAVKSLCLKPASLRVGGGPSRQAGTEQPMANALVAVVLDTLALMCQPRAWGSLAWTCAALVPTGP